MEIKGYFPLNMVGSNIACCCAVEQKMLFKMLDYKF
jgi:hypothetical protein